MTAATGTLSAKQLEELAESGEIDTVLCMFTDLQGRFMGKRVVPHFLLEEILGEEGLHACLYLLAIDMEMEPLPGYQYASWETGYGDFRMVPDMSTLRWCPWIEKTVMVICDIFEEEQADKEVEGRNIFSLSRAGYFPKWMSITHKTRKTPYVALLLGGVVGYGLAWWINESSGTNVGAALLTMAVFGAVISYFMQMLSFIVLRRKLPNIDRPYRSPVGVWGAAIAGIIALIALVSLYLDDSYRPGVIGAAIWFLLGIIYFAIAGRNRLVLSPEEEFALTSGERGIPQEAGYSTTREEQEAILRGETAGPGSAPPPSGPTS